MPISFGTKCSGSRRLWRRAYRRVLQELANQTGRGLRGQRQALRRLVRRMLKPHRRDSGFLWRLLRSKSALAFWTGLLVSLSTTHSQAVGPFSGPGSGGPLWKVQVGSYSKPAWVDIDGDGDLDVFIGSGSTGTIRFYRNVGNKTTPSFREQTGSRNPFDGVFFYDDPAPTFADIDGDGDLDAFVGLSNGLVRYFRNDGTANPVFHELTGADNPLQAFNDISTGYLNSAVPTFVDIDGDGDLDAFIGARQFIDPYYGNQGRIFYYRNDGTNLSPNFTRRDGPGNPLGQLDYNWNHDAAPAFVDIDGDGDLDAFIGLGYNYSYSFGTRRGNIRYLRNDGTKSNPIFQPAVSPLGEVAGEYDTGLAPSFADLDGDGDFDAFLGNPEGTIRYWQNLGSDTKPDFGAQRREDLTGDLGFKENLTAPAMVDIDGDGDLDLFVGLGSGRIEFLRNVGSNANPVFELQRGANNPFYDFYFGPRSMPAFADIDGDGDFDAFVGSFDGGIRFFRNGDSSPNKTNPIFTEQTGADNPLAATYGLMFSAPTFVDIDGDGDLDAIIVGAEPLGDPYPPFQWTVRYYRNDDPSPNKTSPNFVLQTAADNPFHGLTDSDAYHAAPTFADIDGDGDLDAFLGNFDGTVRFFRNEGSRTNPNLQRKTGANNPLHGVSTGTPPYGGVSTPAFADIDGDGDLDLIVGEYRGRVHVFRNQGSQTSPNFEPRTPLGDVGDTSEEWRTAPTFVDIDGDGDMDAFIGNQRGILLYFRNDGNRLKPSFSAEVTDNPLAEVAVGDSSAPTFVDIDGDGDFDAFVGKRVGEIRFYRNVGTTTSPSFTSETGGNNPFYGLYTGYSSKPAFVDIDGDGDFDAFVGRGSNGIRFYRNVGTRTEPSFVEQTGPDNPLNGYINYVSLLAPAFVDIDGDGDFDAIIGSADGTLRYLRNDGTSTSPSFNEQSGASNPLSGVRVGASGNGDSTPAFVDIDGDGDFDLFVGDHSGRIHYFQNDTDASPPSLSRLAPPDNAVGVAPGNNWAITFSEKVVPGTGNVTLHRAADGVEVEAIDMAGGAVSGNGTLSLTLHRTSNLTGATEFYVIVPDGAIEDLEGNPFAGISSPTTWSFTSLSSVPVVITSPTTLPYVEGQGALAIDGTLTVTDADSAELVGATVSLTSNFTSGEDVLGFSNQNGISGSYDSGTGVLSLTGTVTVGQYEAALRSVTYANTSNNPNQATRTIRFVVNDGALSSTAATRQVAITGVNAAPTLDPPAPTLAIEEDAGEQTVILTGISAGGGENQTLAVTASSSDPQLIPHPTVAYSSPSTTATLKLTPVANAHGSALITIVVNDGGGTALGGVETVTTSFSVIVAAMNDPPTLNSVADLAIPEDAPAQTVVLTGIGSGAPNEAQALTLTATSDQRALIPDPTVSYSSPNSTASLRFVSLTNATGAARITVTVADSDGAVTLRTFTVTVNPINDAPTISGIADQTIDEDTSTGPLLFMIEDPEADAAAALFDNLRVSLDQSYFPGNGLEFGDEIFLANPSLPATDFQFATFLSSNATGNETVELFLRNATTSLFPGSLLYASGPVVLDPGFQLVTISDSFGVLSNSIVWSAKFSGIDASEQAGLLLYDPPLVGSSLDDFLVLANGSWMTQVIADGATPGNFGARIATAATGLTITAVSSNPNLIPNQNVILEGEGSLRTVTATPLANASGSATITLSVTDAEGASSTAAFLVTVTSVNDPPTIGPVSSQTLNEDSLKTLSFTISDVESAASGLGLAASSSNEALLPARNILFGGAGSDRSVVLVPAADQFGTSQVTLTVRDSAGGASATSFTVTVHPVNDPPSLDVLANVTFNEDSAQTVHLAGIRAGPANENQVLAVTVISSDPSLLPLPVIHYTSPNTTGTLDFTPASNANGTATITVTVSDDNAAGGPSLSLARSFAVTVIPVNDLPTISVLSSQSMNEDSAMPLGFTVGDVETPAGELTITAGSSNETLLPIGRIVPAGSGAGRSVTLSPLPDQSGTTLVTLTASDAYGGASSTSFTLTVNPVNDPPKIASAAFSVDETVPVGTLVGTVSATDIDFDQLVFAITGGNTAAAFAIDGNTGRISVNGLLDFESQRNYSLSVRVTDRGSPAQSDTALININVTDANEAPVVANQEFEVQENQANVLVGRVVAADADAGPAGRLAYAIAGGNEAGHFRLTQDTGELILDTPVDYETQPGHEFSLTVEVKDSGSPPKSASTVLKVRLQNVDEPPTLGSIPGPIIMAEDSGERAVDLPGVSAGDRPQDTLQLEAKTSATGVIQPPTVAFDNATGIWRLRLEPAANAHGNATITVTLRAGTGASAQSISRSVAVVVNPMIDGSPRVTDAMTKFGQQTTSGLVILANELDGTEVTHFKVTQIQDGNLFRHNGVIPVLENEFIPAFEAAAGLRFTPGLGNRANGSFTVQASLNNNDSGLGGVASVASINVEKAPQSIEFAQPPARSFGEPAFNLQAQATSGLAVSFEVIAGPATVSGNTITLNGAGTLRVAASQTGDNNYEPAVSVFREFIVSRANQTIAFPPLAAHLYGDAPVVLNATASSGLSVSYAVGAGSGVIEEGNKVRIQAAGTIVVKATQSGNENYEPAPSLTQFLTVSKAALVVTAANDSRVVRKPNPVLSGTITGLKGQDNVTVRFETAANESSPPGTYLIHPVLQDPQGRLINYLVSVNPGILTVVETTAPTAITKSLSTPEETRLGFDLEGTDPDGDALTFRVVAGPDHGTLEGVAPHLTYIPNRDYNGPDTVRFRVNDGRLESLDGLVNITVTPVNDPPTLDPIADIALRPSAGPQTILLTGISSGPSTESSTLSITAVASNPAVVAIPETSIGYTSPNPAGTLTFVPAADVRDANATITVTVSDGDNVNGKVSRSFQVEITDRLIRIVNQIAMPGNVVAVSIQGASSGNEQSLAFSLRYNPSVLSFVDATPGSGGGGSRLNVNTALAKAGQVGLALAAATGQVFPAGSPELVVAFFRVVDDVAAMTLASTPIEFGDTPWPRATQDADARRLPTTYENGVLSLSRGFEADVTPRPFGNNDGTVRASDWTQVGLFAARLMAVENASEFQRADCAPRTAAGVLTLGNGIISLADWVQAGRYVAGLDAANPGGGPYAPAQVLTRATGLRSPVTKSVSSAGRTIRAKNCSTVLGQSILVPIELDALGRENAVGLSVTFDPTVLRLVNARLGRDAAAATLLTNSRDAGVGRIGLALALAPGQSFESGTRTLMEIEFELLTGGVEISTEIGFGDIPIAREIVSSDADELQGVYESGIVLVRETGPSTDPHASARLQLTGRSATGEFSLQLTGEPGKTYTVETSTDLVTWVLLKTVTLAGRDLEWVDAETRNLARRFYRVRPLP